MILSVLIVMSFIVFIISSIVVMVVSHKAYHTQNRDELSWCYGILDVVRPVFWVHAVILVVSVAVYALV